MHTFECKSLAGVELCKKLLEITAPLLDAVRLNVLHCTLLCAVDVTTRYAQLGGIVGTGEAVGLGVAGCIACIPPGPPFPGL
ncbi:MAG TPA: hypothetical protein VKF82_11945 [Candidatus Eremiobacteraceae bacterium]|nr:hypothetical protein [Candidatus Eremiobacteraceae bacterium]